MEGLNMDNIKHYVRLVLSLLFAVLGLGYVFTSRENKKLKRKIKQKDLEIETKKEMDTFDDASLDDIISQHNDSIESRDSN